MKASETAAVKTDAADMGDIKDTKSEADKKHKQRRWSEVPDTNTVSKVCCMWMLFD